MLVHKCDRCGTIFDDAGVGRGHTFDTIKTYVAGNANYADKFELCADCRVDFTRWLERKPDRVKKEREE